MANFLRGILITLLGLWLYRWRFPAIPLKYPSAPAPDIPVKRPVDPNWFDKAWTGEL